MRNFRKILLRVMLLGAFLMVFNKAVRFVYEEPNQNVIYTRSDLKKSNGEVETLILGTSLMHWGVNGQVLGEVLDSPTFNLATSSQPMDGTYYLLKDQIKHNPLKRVFLGVHVTVMQNDTNSNINLRRGIFDRIQSPLGKLEYMFKTAEPKEYESYLFYSTRVDNVMTWEVAKSNVKYKLSDDYRNNKSPENSRYTYQTMGDENTEKIYDGSFSVEKLRKSTVWNRKRLLEINTTHLQKIADICKKNGVELNLVIPPMTWEYTKHAGDLDDMHNYFQEFCDENDANLYDFTYYDGIYDIFPNEYFQDKKHLNARGAVKFAELIGETYLEDHEEQ